MSFGEILQPGDGVLDLGANVGDYACGYAERVGPTGHVLAVEPDPETVVRLREKTAKHPQIEVLPAGIDAVMRHGLLYRDTDRKRNSAWLENVLEDAKQSVEVDFTTLDEVARLVPNLKAIKVDIQGAEMRMLQGGTKTLQNTALTWFVEIWPTGLTNAGSSAEELIRTFEDAGWVPVGHGWQRYRDAIPGSRGHGSMDVLLQHKDRPDYSLDG